LGNRSRVRRSSLGNAIGSKGATVDFKFNRKSTLALICRTRVRA
jgi:hypothetical protein